MRPILSARLQRLLLLRPLQHIRLHHPEPPAGRIKADQDGSELRVPETKSNRSVA